MNRVSPENLVAGQRYRIHWNGYDPDHSMDDLGTFVQMRINGAEFRDLNVYNPAGRMLVDVFHYKTDAFTFYESAEQLNVRSAQRQALKEELEKIPGTKHTLPIEHKTNFFGGLTKRRRKRRTKKRCQLKG